jgi:predicted secreted Zn-dependent protease
MRSFRRSLRAPVITTATMLALLVAMTAPSQAQPVVIKTYSYFSIGGKTAEELDAELERRGPLTRHTGARHPGATEIKFGGEVSYVERGGRCSIGSARVTLRTHIILPRWRNRGSATGNLARIWDALSADIKRHEERHAEISRTHARTLEAKLLAIRPAGTCDVLEKRVGEISRNTIEAHDQEQLRFDMVESKNFDRRIMRVLKNRGAAID